MNPDRARCSEPEQALGDRVLGYSSKDIRGSKRTRTEPSLGAPARVALLSLPTLASFGPLLPAAGPFFASRILIVLLFMHAVTLKDARGGDRPFTRKIALAALIWLVFVITLEIVRPMGSTAISEVLSVGIGVMLLIAYSRLPDPRDGVRWLLGGWLVSSLIISALAVRESVSGVHWANYLTGSDVADRTDQLAVTFGNPNNFAFFLVGTLPFVTLLWRVGRTRSIRLSAGLATFAIFPLLLGSGSRLGILLAVPILFIVGFPRLRTAARVALAGAAMCSLVSLFVLAPKIGASLCGVFFSAQACSINQGVGSLAGADLSGGVRLNLMLNGFEMIPRSYGLGFGPGGFADQIASGRYSNSTAGVLSPHSVLLEVAANYGIVAVFGLTALIFSMFRIGIRALKRTGNTYSRGISLALVTSTVLFPVMGQMNSSWLIDNISWMLLASYILIARSLLSDQSADLGDSSSTQPGLAIDHADNLSHRRSAAR